MAVTRGAILRLKYARVLFTSTMRICRSTYKQHISYNIMHNLY